MAANYEKRKARGRTVAPDIATLKERLIAFIERHISEHKEIRAELYGYLKQVKAIEAEDGENAPLNYAKLKALSRAAQALVIRNSTLLDRAKILCRARNYQLPPVIEDTIITYEQRVAEFMKEVKPDSIRAAARDWLIRFWVEPVLQRLSSGYLPSLDSIDEQDAFALWLDDFTRQKLTELSQRIERWQEYLEKYRPSAIKKFDEAPEVEEEDIPF